MNEDKDWKVIQVSQEPPREWNNPKGGVIYYKKVMLEGWDKPVSVGKKSPDALSVGSTVYGHPEIAPGMPEDKFKAGQKPFGGNSFGGSTGGSTPHREYVDHHEEIKAQWAIGQAVNLLKQEGGKTPAQPTIELWADTFYMMVNRVKNGENPNFAPNTTKEALPIDTNDAEYASLVERGYSADDIPTGDIPF